MADCGLNANSEKKSTVSDNEEAVVSRPYQTKPGTDIRAKKETATEQKGAFKRTEGPCHGETSCKSPQCPLNQAAQTEHGGDRAQGEERPREPPPSTSQLLPAKLLYGTQEEIDAITKEIKNSR